MDLRSDDFTRQARAPAKLNLFLEVLGRRCDGFHELETLMVPVRIYDQLSVTATRPADHNAQGEITLDVHTCWPVGLDQPIDAIPSGEDNLVVRALRLLQERSGCDLGARVTLVKRIPAAAGLGGGSSDAATALRLANHVWQIGWDSDRLATLAAELGSDIPFFFAGGPAICRGRGEKVEALPPTSRLHFVIVKPPTGLSTAAVFRALDECSQPDSESLRKIARVASALSTKNLSELRNGMFNRLQSAAARLSPWISQVSSLFDRLGVVAHQLTGSGTAYFGVCRHAQHARRLASILRTRQLGLVYATCSCQ